MYFIKTRVRQGSINKFFLKNLLEEPANDQQ